MLIVRYVAYFSCVVVLVLFFFLMTRRPPRSTLDRSSAASDVYKRQPINPAGTCDPLTAGVGHVNSPGCGTGVFQTDVYQCVDAAMACPPPGAPPPPPGGDCTYNLPIGWDEGQGAALVQCYSMPLTCLLYTSPSPRDRTRSRMPSSA